MASGRAEEMWPPERVHELSVLRGFYEELLSPRQREVLALKLDEDLSLAEMAERLGVSRQACEDALKRAERALRRLEGRLGLLSRHIRERKVLEEAIATLSGACARDWRKSRSVALTLLRSLRDGGEASDGV